MRAETDETLITDIRSIFVYSGGACIGTALLSILSFAATAQFHPNNSEPIDEFVSYFGYFAAVFLSYFGAGIVAVWLEPRLGQYLAAHVIVALLGTLFLLVIGAFYLGVDEITSSASILITMGFYAGAAWIGAVMAKFAADYFGNTPRDFVSGRDE